jgi:hypothetical protein
MCNFLKIVIDVCCDEMNGNEDVNFISQAYGQRRQ